MAYQAPKKKKEWWETALNVAGKVAGNVAGRAVDYVVPGDQSSLYRNKQVLPTFKPSVPQPVVNTAKNVGSALWNSTVNPVGKNGLFGTQQQESFSNFIKPAVSGLNRYQSAIDSTDKQAGFQWNDPNDYKRFAQKLPAGMVQGVIEAPRLIGEGMSGQRLRDDKLENITPAQRAASIADASLSTIGLVTGGSGRLLKSFVPGARNAATGFVRAAGGIVKDGVKEGAEEVLQLAASDKADNNRFDATWKDYRDAGGLGTLAGTGMSGAGRVVKGAGPTASSFLLDGPLTKLEGSRQDQAGFIGGKGAKDFDKFDRDGKTFVGADGMKKFEGSDHLMKFRDDYDISRHVATGARVPLDKVIDHPELFKQYPAARDVEVKFTSDINNANGAYNEETNTLYLHPKNARSVEQQLDTIVHENDHFLQGVENFARGSSPSIHKRKRLEQLSQMDRKAHEKLKELGHLPGKPLTYKDGDAVDKLFKQRDRYRVEYRNIENGLHDKKFKRQYLVQDGEVGSRNSARRRKMTPEERYVDGRSTFEDTADVHPSWRKFTREKGRVVGEAQIRDNAKILQLDETIAQRQQQIDNLRANGRAEGYSQIVQLEKSIDDLIRQQDVIAKRLSDQGMAMSEDVNVDPVKQALLGELDPSTLSFPDQAIYRELAKDSKIRNLREVDRAISLRRKGLPDVDDPIKRAFDDDIPVESLSPEDRAIYDSLLVKDITYEQLASEIDKARVYGITPVLESSNPTGSVFVDYDPASRTGDLGENMTTLDKVAGRNPDDIITVYRGTVAGQDTLQPGDFITTNPQLAQDYAGNGNVITEKVKASEIVTDKTEWEGEEYIYQPKTTSEPIKQDIRQPEFTNPIIQEPRQDVVRHFTSKEAAQALRSGAPFDFTRDPIHGAGDKTLGNKTDRFVRDGGPAIYLSLDDSKWNKSSSLREFTPDEVIDMSSMTPDQVTEFFKNGGTAGYNYKTQRYEGVPNGTVTQDLEAVDYVVDPSARKLVIDSSKSYEKARQELGTTPDDPAFWSKARQKYDVVEIRNTDEGMNIPENVNKSAMRFFTAAKGDQQIVLNTDMVRLAGTAPKTVKIKQSKSTTEPENTNTQPMRPITERDEEGRMVTRFEPMVDTEVGRTNTETGEIEMTPAETQAIEDNRTQNANEVQEAFDTYANKPVREIKKGQKINEDVKTEAPLGSIMQTFYDSKGEGNQAIRFGDIRAMADTVAARTWNDFADIGSDFRDVARTTQEAVDNGATSLDDVNLTPQEKAVWTAMESELDYIRRRASLGNKEVSDGDKGELYFSRVSPDARPGREEVFQGFRDKKPGSEFARRRDEFALKADEISYSPQVLSKYITDHADSKALRQERIYRAMERDNPGMPEEALHEAAGKMITLQDKINQQKVKLKYGGVKKVTVTDGKSVDVVAELNEIGKTFQKPMKVIADTPRGLTNGDRLNSVDVDMNGKMVKLADALGMNQFRDSTAYAFQHMNVANGDMKALGALVRSRLESAYNIPADSIDYAVETIERMKPGLPPEVVAGKVESIYRQAGKGQMLEALQSMDIQNKTLRRDVNEIVKQTVREGTTEKQLSAKVVQTTLRAQNALFRKLNVSSALNELSDLTSFVTIYGTNTKLFTPDIQLVKDLGLGEIDPSIQPYLRQIENGEPMNKVLSAIKKTNNGTRLYKFVETYKAGVLAKTAKEFYSKPENGGLKGDALTAKILEDYRNFALPVDMFTKTFLDDFPLFTQYMTWGARNLQKEGRLLTGQFDAGVMKDKSQAARIARNAYANLPAKTVFWLASNGLKGTAIMTAFGLTDFLGLAAEDYSGIEEEDKSLFDKAARWTNVSTTMSLINTIVQDWEKEKLKEKYADADYNPYEHDNFTESLINTYTPQFIKNIRGGMELNDKGFSENKSGRVQYEAPDDIWNKFKSFAFGKNQTENAREYSGNENIFDRLKEGKNIFTGVKDMALEQLSIQDRDYNRPLNDDYSAKYKEVDEASKTALLDGGRKYNSALDNLRKNNPDLYQNYIASMSDHVNPEMWRARSMGEDGKVDLTTFHVLRDRKRQLQKDLGTAYDPMYDLPDDQAAAVLQLKSAPTGDDIALRNILGKEQWYKDLKERQKSFYDSNPFEGGEWKDTERVKEWNALDDKLSGFFFDSEAEKPEWASQFPLVYQQKAINDKYGFGSAESDAFFKSNADGYQAQKRKYDEAQLEVINQMRKIEGHPPLSWDAYLQATEYADTQEDKDKKKAENDAKYAKKGGSDLGSSPYANVSYTSAGKLSIKQPSVSAKKVKIKSKYPSKKITIKRGGKMK